MKKPTRVDELMKRRFPDTTLVEGGLLFEGSRLVIGGETGAGKSYLTLQLELEAAAGEPWLGLWKVRKPLNSLLIQTEITEALLAGKGSRLARWKAGAPIPENFWLSTEESFSIVQEAPGLERMCGELDINLVAFDPLYQMHSGDENMVHTIKPAEEAFDLVKGPNRAIILDHHFNKASSFTGGKPSVMWLRGSSAWAGWADTVMLLVGQPGAPQAKLHIVKARNRMDALPGAIKLEWQPRGKFFRVVEEEVGSEYAAIQEILEEHGGQIKQGDLAKELMERGYGGRTKAYAIVKEAIDIGFLTGSGVMVKLDNRGKS
ncbi:MAG: AAA family ATPase [Firmicutes bacterium]|nr:AAA family ATPase [Bacillota bacterium]